VTVSPAEARRALADVLDPEYPISLVDMGLIRGVEIEANTARVAVSFCSLGCPCIELIHDDVEQRLLELDGIERVEVVESFDPWTRKDVSRKGLALLRQVGVS
jgi:metal-sulfur cluster biosynthetic enzyme